MKHLRNFILFLLILAMVPLSAFAAGNTLSVFLTPEKEPVPGVAFRVYPVASGISDPQNAYRALVVAKTEPTATATTDANGVAQFEGLADGTYLLIGDAATVGGKTLQPEMCLVTLPHGTERELDIHPKYALTEKQESLEYKLVKIWADKDNLDLRPDSIQVDLYRNGEKKETVKLDAASNWRYSWTDSDSTALWTVVEQVPEAYTAEYRAEGNTFYIENTADPAPTEPDTTTPTEKPNPPKLPQTGQLWWPVPILALAGMALILIGLLRRKEQDYEN